MRNDVHAWEQRGIPRPLRYVLLGSLPLLALISLNPFNHDNAVYQTMAFEIHRYGYVPYIDTWDNNFPGILLIHSLAILLFGSNALGFHIVDALLQLGFLVVLYRLSSLWLKVEAAILVPVVYMLYYFSGALPLYGQRDVYAVMAFVTSFYLVQVRRRTWKIVLAGLLMGYAVMLKPTNGLYLPIVAFMMFARPDIKQLRGMRTSWAVASIVVLSAMPLLLFLASMSSIPGALARFYESTVTINLGVYSQFGGAPSALFFELLKNVLLVPFAVFGAFVAFGSPSWSTVFHTRPSRRVAIAYIAALVFGVVVLLAQHKYLRYHFAPVLVLVVPLAAIGIHALTKRVTDHQKGTALLVLSLFFVSMSPFRVVEFLFPLFAKPSTVPVRENAPLQYIARTSSSSDEIEICSFEPYLRLASDRKCSGPYITLHAIALRTEPSKPNTFTPLQREWQREYVSRLAAKKPKLILLDEGSRMWYLVGAYESTLKYVPGFDSLLAASYEHDTTINDFAIWKRKAGK